MNRQSTLLRTIRIVTLVWATLTVCVSCTKKETVTTMPDIAVDWVSPTAITALNTDSTFCMLNLDGTPLGNSTLEGMPYMAYNDVFPCEVNGQYYVYNTNNTTKRLNSEPFDNITDFRTGYAYASRSGCPLLVVNQLGAVIRVLPERIAEVSIADFMTEQYASARFVTDDECTGVMRPNGEILIEFGRNEVCGYLNDNRIVVFSGKSKKGRVVDTTGKEIYVLDDGYTFTTDYYSGGWIGIMNEDASSSYFADLDGNPAMVLNDGEIPVMRLGDVAVTASNNDDDATYTLTNVVEEKTLYSNVGDVYPVIGSNMELLFIQTTDERGNTVFDIIDSQGTTQNGMRIDEENFSFPFGSYIATGDSDEYAVYDYRNGSRVSTKTYGAVAFNLNGGTVYNVNSSYNEYAELLASYIDQQGMNVDNYLYTSSTTPSRILDNANLNLTDEDCAKALKYMYQSGRRSINLTINDNQMIFTFDRDPYIERETQVQYMDYYTTPRYDTEMNPDCRLQTVTLVVSLDGDISAPIIPTTIDYLVENNGFSRYADIPDTVTNGTVNVMFVASKSRLFITVAFTDIDYSELSSLLSSPMASYNPDATVYDDDTSTE